MKFFLLILFLIIWVSQLIIPIDILATNTISINPFPEHIKLEPVPGTNNIFPSVSFAHKKHYVNYRLPCLTCHHEWEWDDSANPSKCVTCHKTNRDEANKDFILLRNAFHRSCKDCHRRMQEAKGTNAPVKCRECHISYQ